eukprot:13380543-Alexandrium_andersonii.AAC.1
MFRPVDTRATHVARGALGSIKMLRSGRSGSSHCRQVPRSLECGTQAQSTPELLSENSELPEIGVPISLNS